MRIQEIKQELSNKGYVIVPNIISEDEIIYCKKIFREWQKTIPNHDKIHNSTSPHGIYKFHEVGHQRHGWFIRTRKNVQDVFKGIWDCENLVVSFDGSCYIPKSCNKKDNFWTHTDQGPSKKGLHCYQGMVALTENKERTLVVYEGSHKLHEQYFRDRNITTGGDWQVLDFEYIQSIQNLKRILHVPAGSLVIWDSRTYHQNQYGKPNSEERMMQYVCYLPDNHPKNTKAMTMKRIKYFKERRTTSHWPYPIKVNGKQPRSFGNPDRNIDYSTLTTPDLSDLMPEIKKLL